MGVKSGDNERIGVKSVNNWHKEREELLLHEFPPESAERWLLRMRKAINTSILN